MPTVVVSPYHLTTREAPAMASLLLAERVVTLLPKPPAHDDEDEREAAARVPRYDDLLESWSWSLPLWREGVIDSRTDDDDPLPDVAEACVQLATDDRLAEIRPMLGPGVVQAPHRFVEFATRDLLRGGPEPAVSIPIAAGLDRFASRRGFAVARAEPASVAQRAEISMGQRVASLAVPVLIEASGERITEARGALAEELGALRRVLGTVLDEAWTSDEPDQGSLRDAGGSYAAAFDDIRTSLTRPDDDSGKRVRDAMVSVSVVRLPGDAVLVSSLAAARSVRPGRPSNGQGARERFPAGDSVLALVVKALGTRH